jgi:hypothetical protein
VNTLKELFQVEDGVGPFEGRGAANEVLETGLARRRAPFIRAPQRSRNVH